jgi:cytochrome c oxidase subunit IV
MDILKEPIHETGDIHHQVVIEHHVPSSKKLIWKVFFLLLIVTVIEVAFAELNYLYHWFSKAAQNYILIGMTILKAYYIVAYFMHLKHETLSLRYIILLPFILIMYLIIIALVEGSYIFSVG